MIIRDLSLKADFTLYYIGYSNCAINNMVRKMRKLIVFQLILLLSLPALADRPLTLDSRQVPVNRGGVDDGTICLYFFEDMPSVPYISEGVYIVNGKKVVK